MGKKIYTNQLVEYVGEEITELFFVNNLINNHNRQGTIWTTVQITDKTGTVNAKIWSEFSEEDAEECQNQVCRLTGKVDIYNGVPGIAISKLSLAENYDESDFAKELNEEEKKKAYEDLDKYISSVSNKGYQNLLRAVFSERNREKMASLPAGIKSHHCYNGGLLCHTLEVVRMAEGLMKARLPFGKEGTTNMDRDLLVTAGLLHDIGKITAYRSFPMADRTVRGKLLNPSLEGVAFVVAYNGNLANEERVTDTAELLHCMTAAHKEVYGGIKPCMQEAILLRMANEASIKEDGYREAFLLDAKKHPGKERQFIYSSMHENVLYGKREKEGEPA